MGGALIQLIAYGVQDTYLTGEANVSYFKKAIQRSTPFALESIEQVIQGSVETGQVNIDISRNGDLVYGLWFEITLTKQGVSNFPAEQVLKNVELSIGGQRVDYVDSDWMAIRRELFLTADQRDAYYEMNNFRPDDPDGMEKTFYVKVPFFFNSGDVSKAIPLIALQYHEVSLLINFETSIPGVSGVPKVRAFADYVFLDTMERQWFTSTSHDYLIEQVQIQTSNLNMDTVVKKHRVALDFNHPVRYIVWAGTTAEHGAFSASQQPFEANDVYSPISSCRITINGTERFQERDGSYFRFVQPYSVIGKAPSAGIYMYSFGFNNTSNTNTGTLNFSRIDMANFDFTTKAASAATIADVVSPQTTTVSALDAFTHLKFFAANYNVLRIQSGMGGLKFAN